MAVRYQMTIMRSLVYFLRLSPLVAFPLVGQNVHSPSTALFASPTANRRQWVGQAAASFIGVVGSMAVVVPSTSSAIETTVMESKTFVDPYFAITVPTNYFTLRRSSKGDLPDAKTGKGRRGASIFTAGNMAKAEVIAVER